ncbi:MAG: aldehyde dehydrogenase family protein [bacterium]
MRECTQFYINGEWVNPSIPNSFDVINPANEQVCAHIALGSETDLDLAVAAAKTAFSTYSCSSKDERVALLEKIIEVYRANIPEMGELISLEMGAPMSLAINAQAKSGLGHLKTTLQVLKDYQFEEQVADNQRIVQVPIGVCGLITPWNWPMNQVMLKVAPALATGCTMLLKPSEVAPLSSYLLSQILHEAGVPAGVYNMVNGDGPVVGTAMSKHPDVAMVSFTGSTRAGTLVAQNAAPTVKRVAQELGGKSPNIILADADIEAAVKRGVLHMFGNSGQSCNAPSRMIVPREKLTQAEDVARTVAAKVVVGDPSAEGTTMGPVVSQIQFDKIQGLIQAGVEEGAKLVCGGPGRPEGLDKGYYCKPTVFSEVSNSMRIAQEEIFGPVLTMIPYDTEEEAIRIANDTEYGLAGYVQGGDEKHMQAVAAQIRAGNIHLNGANPIGLMPFGGFKMSGNGRESGPHGFTDYLEVKGISG